MKRVIIVGSPRSNGRCAHLAEMLFEANIDERPEDELYLVPVSEIEIGPCIGCGACKKQSEVTFKDDDGNEVTELRNRCIFDDDMQTLYDLLDEADALTIVTPVYFSGAPAPMKCVLDRLQPYFWPYLERGPRLPKRPLELHVVGEGGDPHGFDPLIGEVRSATLLAGFEIERIFNWVGKISAEGEILEEAVVLEPPTKPARAKEPSAASTDDAPAAPDAKTAPAGERRPRAQGKPRPKLDFSKGANKPAGKGSANAKPKSNSNAKSKSNGDAKSKSNGNAKRKGGRRG